MHCWSGEQLRRRIDRLSMLQRLSIIIPVLNEAAGIVQLLLSLADMRKAGCEIIVVDGGSEDETFRLAVPLSDRVISTSPGRARQMNAGAEHASGDVLLFLHADTILPQDAGHLVLDSLLRTGRAWGRFDVRLTGQRMIFRVIERMMNWRSRMTGIATGDQGIFVRREIFRQAGGYEEIPLMEDIALSKALRKYTPPLCISEKLVTSSRRWEKHGIYTTIVLMWSLRIRYAMGVDAGRLAREYK